MTALFFATYLGYVTTKKHCVDWDCHVIKAFKNQPCQVQFGGQWASVLGIGLPVKQYMFGYTNGYDGMANGTEVTVFFRPGRKILRAYVAQYQTEREYDRWTCEFGREGEGEWK